MATTYTANARLQKPAPSDRIWDVPINANADTIDGMTAIGGLVVTTSESPSISLNVRVAPGNFVNSFGRVTSFTSGLRFAVPVSSTVYLWLTDAGVLSTGSSFPTSAHLRLAHVVSGSASVSQVVDERIQCSVTGTGLGFVLKTGDTMTGPLAVVSPVTSSPLVVADSINRLIGFFGVTPVSQAPVLTSLVSISSGVASDTLADVGMTFSQSVLNNNFTSLAAKVDGLIAALKRHGLMGS